MACDLRINITYLAVVINRLGGSASLTRTYESPRVFETPQDAAIMRCPGHRCCVALTRKRVQMERSS